MEPIRRLLPAVLAVSLATGVAACSGGGGAADTAGAPTPTPSAAASPPATVAPTRPPAATRPPATPRKADPSAPFDLPKTTDPKTALQETLTGTVVAGTEAGCLLLEGYLLVNAPTDVVKVGARVRVTGHIRTDLVSTCQQGIPLVVQTARAA